MRVLVTRAREDARRTAEKLARHGHKAVLAPLSEIRLLATEQPDLTNVQAILATSSNGIRAFAALCARRDIRVLAVGENTAATARSAGFIDVGSADGDSAALVTRVRRELSPAAGALLQVTGRNRARLMHAVFARAGFECRTLELYEFTPCRALPEQVTSAFRRGDIDAVLVLSPESGRILVEALTAAGVAPDCGQVAACCISGAAAEKIRGIAFGVVRIAEAPTLDAVVALLDLRPAGSSIAGD